MAFANAAVSDIIATTIQSRTGIIADNVTSNNALLMRLKQRGNIKSFSGGNSIFQELSFAANGNAGWYSGYETLPIAAQDVLSSAEYTIKQAACPVTISGLEQLQNAGKEQIIDLLDARMAVAESSMANLIATGLYSDGTAASGKQIDGLGKQVIKVPTSGVVGGIDRATWQFWRNQVFAAIATGGTATTAANVQTYFNRLWAKLVRGNDRPDLIMVDNNYWAFYMASLQLIQRFAGTDTAKLGFVSLKYMDADVVLDGGMQINWTNTGAGGTVNAVPASQAYFLNSKYLFYRPHSQRNMVPLSPGQRYSVNQDAAVQILAWAGNLTSSGLQFQGTMFES
jgi:hypothetical protein